MMDDTTLFTTAHRAKIEAVKARLRSVELSDTLSGSEVMLCIAGADHGFGSRQVFSQIVSNRADAVGDYLVRRMKKAVDATPGM